MSQSILKNLLAKGVLSTFNIIVPLLIIPYVYRVLNPEIVGEIEYATTIYTYFGLIGALGIYNYGLREISRQRNQESKVSIIYKNLFCIGLFANLIVFVVFECFVYYFVIDVQARKIMTLLGFSLIAQVFSIEWVNEAYEDFKFITLKTIIIRLFSLVAILLFVRQTDDYVCYVLITVLVLFFNNIVSYVHMRKYIKFSFLETFTGLELKKYIVPLLFILVLNNTNVLYTMVDRTMLGIYTGPEQVAYYSIGQKIVEIIKALLLSVVFVTLPRFSLCLEENRPSYILNIRKIIRLMLLIIFPVSLLLFMFSEEIVLLFAGKQYLPAIPSLHIFSIRIILLSIESVLYNQVIFLHRKEKFLLFLNLLCGGLNVGLNFYFVKSLTPSLAIATTLFAELVFQFVCLFYIKKKLHFTVGVFSLYNLKYLLLSLLFVPIVVCFRHYIENMFVYVALSSIFCMLVYYLGLVLLKDEMLREIKLRIKL